MNTLPNVGVERVDIYNTFMRELPKELLEEIVRRLVAALRPHQIFLFGSYAYGKPHSDSDLDLLVVVPKTELSFFERGAIAYRALRRIGMAIDVQVYTKKEFDSRSALKVSFERTVLDKGRVIYAA